jgi:drug/metabolite transporter (DMT)-like permease
MLALFEPFLYFLGESYGMLFISSTLASIIIATIPLVTPFAGYYFYREKLTPNNYLGILISFLGVVLVVYIDGKTGNAPWFGISLLVMAVLSTMGYTVLLKRLLEKYNALSIVWFQNLIGGIYFVPLFLFTEARNIVWEKLTLKDFMPVLYLAVFASSLAFVLFIQGIKKLGITKSVVFTNFIPIVTAVFAITILQEKLPLLKITGIFITILGLVMSQIVRFPKIRAEKKIT